MSTTSARVRCPHCGKSFKIPDRSLLGRTGKCSACAQKFTLTEDPGGAAASDAATATTPEKSRPATPAATPAASKERSKSDSATSAAKPAASKTTDAATPGKVPDVAKPATAPAKAAKTPPAELAPPGPPPSTKPAREQPAVKSAAAAKPATESLRTKPTPGPVVAEEIPFGLNAKWVPDETGVAEPSPGPFAPTDESDPFGAAGDVGVVEAPRRKTPVTTAEPSTKPRKSRSRNRLIGAGAAVVVIGGVLAAIALSRGPSSTSSTGGTPVNPSIAAVPAAPAAYTREMLKGNLALIDEFRPTHGRPVTMQYVPNGVNLVVHLRPAELWGSDRAAAELRPSLTEGVTSWLDGRIKELCRREPARVSEVTFAFVLGAFGTQPTSTQVVRLTQPDKMSTLLDEFRGKALKEDLKPPVNVSDAHAYVIVDASTFSISPAATADELEESLAAPNSYTSKNVIELLKYTDRDRLLTVVAEMQDLRRHVDTLFVESARPTVHAILDWLGEDVDAVAWSLHAKPALYSELALRPKAGVSPRALEGTIQKKLDELPIHLMKLVKGTRPASKGFRELVGRYPAMIEAVKESTVLRADPKELRAFTLLPAKAAPNLALGTLLTWDEIRKAPSAGSAAVASAVTEKVADKLKKEILAEFNRVPLEQAIKYIGDQTGVDFSVDGEALRLTGYTRNMPQTMSLGNVPATKALKAMLDVPNQKDLAVFVDEAGGKAVMSTKPYLKQQGKTEFKVE